MIPVRGPHQSEALGGCLVCLCLRPALNLQYTWDSLLHIDDDTFVNNRIKKGLLIFLSVNVLQSYKQERGCIVHIVRLATTLLKRRRKSTRQPRSCL